jgi:hypothetical protein
MNAPMPRPDNVFFLVVISSRCRIAGLGSSTTVSSPEFRLTLFVCVLWASL